MSQGTNPERISQNNELLIANNQELAELKEIANALPQVLNTSDATATVNDIKNGQTAYVNGQKITGVVPYYGQKVFTDGTIYNVTESSALRFIKLFDTGVVGFNYGGACIVEHPYSKVASTKTL